MSYSFCELGENVEERIQAGPQRTVSGNVVQSYLKVIKLTFSKKISKFD